MSLMRPVDAVITVRVSDADVTECKKPFLSMNSAVAGDIVVPFITR